MLCCLSVAARQKVTISGFVKDIQSHETLLGAAVQDATSRPGTTTNSFGFYSLTLPASMIQLRISCIGYAEDEEVRDLQNDTVINVFLTAPADLPEVIVSPEK